MCSECPSLDDPASGRLKNYPLPLSLVDVLTLSINVFETIESMDSVLTANLRKSLYRVVNTQAHKIRKNGLRDKSLHYFTVHSSA